MGRGREGGGGGKGPRLSEIGTDGGGGGIECYNRSALLLPLSLSLSDAEAPKQRSKRSEYKSAPNLRKGLITLLLFLRTRCMCLAKFD